MRKRNTTIVSALVLVALVVPAWGESSVWGNDPTRNMVLPATGLPDRLDDSTLLWEVEVDARHQFPMPTIVGDQVLVGGDAGATLSEDFRRVYNRGGTYTSYDLHTGEAQWQIVIPCQSYTHSYGVCTTPAIEGDRVYLLALFEVLCLDLRGLTNGNDGMTDELEFQTHVGDEDLDPNETITKLPEISGDILWRYSLKPHDLSYQDASSASALMVGEQLWIATSHQLGPKSQGWRGRGGSDGEHLMVFDKKTGKLIARCPGTIPFVYHGEWSSPSLIEVDGEKVVIFPDGVGVLRGYAIPTPDPSGEVVKLEELWALDINPRDWKVAPDGRRFPYTYDGRLFWKYPPGYPKDANDWVPREQTPTGDCKTGGPSEIIARPVVVGNRIYVGLGRDCYYNKFVKGRSVGWGRFVCLEVDNPASPPRVVWEDRQVGRTQSTAIVHDGLVYVADAAGMLHCLDAQTGKRYWKQDLGARVTCRSPMLADGKIYIANDKGEMHVIAAGKEKSDPLSVTRLRGEPTTIAADDGVIVVATEKKVRAFKGPGYRPPLVAAPGELEACPAVLDGEPPSREETE